MCTLILGVNVLAPRSVILAANRDEDPSRPSAPPAVLAERPRVAGGRDARAGGTWLAIRERRAAVALLNRRDPPAAGTPAARRSRGLLTLDVARVAEDDGRSPLEARAAEALQLAVARDAYAPFSLLYASPEASWVAVHAPADPIRFAPIGPGWHVITHRDLDDPGEPRTAWLRDDLQGWAPAGLAEARAGLVARLAHHGDGNTRPPVCIHEGRMVTVSASVVWLAEDEARYFHAEGRPCLAPMTDLTPLLEGR